MIGRIEQLVLVPLHRLQPLKPFAIDVDVAGRAGAAASAEREQLVEPVVADVLHHAPAGAALDLVLGAVAGDDDEAGHERVLPDARNGNAGAPVYARRLRELQAGAGALGIGAERLKESLDALAGIEPAFAEALARAGYPEPRISERGFVTLLRAIVGQQVSIKAAASIWAKLDAATGGAANPANVAAASDEALRGAGLSGQKVGYARSLAEEVLSGRLDFDALPDDDEEAIARLVGVKGIGRWTAEIYLLFAEGRGDVFPAGDLAVQIELARILGLDEARPSEKAIRALAERWRPHRGAAAVFAWHHRRAVPL